MILLIDAGNSRVKIAWLAPGESRRSAPPLVLEHAELPGLAARYSALAVPVDILYGRQDRILDARVHGESMPSIQPRVRLSLVDGGHMLPVTQPEMTMQWLLDVAARNPSATYYGVRNAPTVSTHAANDAA